jgi:hypothetical protein
LKTISPLMLVMGVVGIVVTMILARTLSTAIWVGAGSSRIVESGQFEGVSMAESRRKCGR